jgi:UDP-GlcNAc:undecaprenyl-phosphate GlcNAc-1-phosphate transferase
MSPTLIIAVLLLIGGVPVVDTLFAMARRMIGGRSPFHPDRGHAHHILLDFKLLTWEVLSMLVVTHGILVGAGYYLLIVYQ